HRPLSPWRYRLCLRKGHEDRHAGLGAHLARAVPLAGQVLGDEDVARPEPLDRPIADLDVDAAGEGEDGVATGRVVRRVGARGLEAADDDAAARDQLGRFRAVTPRLPAGLDLLEVGLSVAARVD